MLWWWWLLPNLWLGFHCHVLWGRSWEHRSCLWRRSRHVWRRWPELNWRWRHWLTLLQWLTLPSWLSSYLHRCECCIWWGWSVQCWNWSWSNGAICKGPWRNRCHHSTIGMSGKCWRSTSKQSMGPALLVSWIAFSQNSLCINDGRAIKPVQYMKPSMETFYYIPKKEDRYSSS